jgi:hypothetical protein
MAGMIGDQDCTVCKSYPSYTPDQRLPRARGMGRGTLFLPEPITIRRRASGCRSATEKFHCRLSYCSLPQLVLRGQDKVCSAPYVISSSQPYNYFAGKRSCTLILSQPRSKLQLFMSASPKSSCVIFFLVFLFLPESRSRLLVIEKTSTTDHRLSAEYRYLTASSPTLSS